MNKNISRILFIICMFCLLNSILVYADWYKGDATGYDTDTGAGMKMNVLIHRTNSADSLGSYAGTNNLTIKIVDSSGSAIAGASVIFYEAGTSTFVYGMDTDASGEVWAEVVNTKTYDIVTPDSERVWGVAAPNYVTLLNFSATTANITIKTVNSSGDDANNTRVGVYNNGTANIACQANTSSTGNIKCELNSSRYVDVVTEYGANVYGLNLSNSKVVLERYSSSIGKDNMTITSRDPSGSLVANRNIFIYKNGTENGVYVPACYGIGLNRDGKVKCELNWSESDKFDIFYTHSSASSSSGTFSDLYEYDGILHLWKRGVSFNSPLDVNINEQNATLNITLIDNDGAVSGKEINVTVYGSDNLSCRGNTDANGQFVCGINASYDYDVHVPSGGNYSNVNVPITEVRLKDMATQTINFSRLNITWYDGEGNLITGQRVNVSETSPEGRKDIRDCTGDTNLDGKLFCGLAQNNTYDLMYNHSRFNTFHIIRGIRFNSDVSQSISEGNASLNITLKDNNGNLITNQEINVTYHDSNNISCFGDTDANGVFVCALNASYTYDVHVPSGATYGNVTVPNEFILEDRATPATIPFAKLVITVKNSSAEILQDVLLDVHEAGTTYNACTGRTNSIGKLYCGLDDDKTYDIFIYNQSLLVWKDILGPVNFTIKENVAVPNNITLLPVTELVTINPPTIIALQGKLTDTGGTVVSIASMRINITNDETSALEWTKTFNNVLDDGVFNIGLGAIQPMYLERDIKYSVTIDIDVDATTFSTADLVFGDDDPSGDKIKFVP